MSLRSLCPQPSQRSSGGHESVRPRPCFGTPPRNARRYRPLLPVLTCCGSYTKTLTAGQLPIARNRERRGNGDEVSIAGPARGVFFGRKSNLGWPTAAGGGGSPS